MDAAMRCRRRTRRCSSGASRTPRSHVRRPSSSSGCSSTSTAWRWWRCCTPTTTPLRCSGQLSRCGPGVPHGLHSTGATGRRGVHTRRRRGASAGRVSCHGCGCHDLPAPMSRDVSAAPSLCLQRATWRALLQGGPICPRYPLSTTRNPLKPSRTSLRTTGIVLPTRTDLIHSPELQPGQRVQQSSHQTSVRIQAHQLSLELHISAASNDLMPGRRRGSPQELNLGPAEYNVGGVHSAAPRYCTALPERQRHCAHAAMWFSAHMHAGRFGAQVRGLSAATLNRLAPDLLEDAADYFERAVKQAVLDYRRCGRGIWGLARVHSWDASRQTVGYAARCCGACARSELQGLKGCAFKVLARATTTLEACPGR
jgi:hypothetical protein